MRSSIDRPSLPIFFLSNSLGIPRAKMINPLVPHCYKCARC